MDRLPEELTRAVLCEAGLRSCVPVSAEWHTLLTRDVPTLTLALLSDTGPRGALSAACNGGREDVARELMVAHDVRCDNETLDLAIASGCSAALVKDLKASSREDGDDAWQARTRALRTRGRALLAAARVGRTEIMRPLLDDRVVLQKRDVRQALNLGCELLDSSWNASFSTGSLLVASDGGLVASACRGDAAAVRLILDGEFDEKERDLALVTACAREHAAVARLILEHSPVSPWVLGEALEVAVNETFTLVIAERWWPGTATRRATIHHALLGSTLMFVKGEPID